MMVAFSGYSMLVTPPSDAVGATYVPGPLFEAPQQTATLVRGDAIKKGALRYGKTAWLTPAGSFAGPEWVSSSRALEQDLLVTIVSRCARFELRVRPADVVKSTGGGLSGMGGSGNGAFLIRAGAVVYWPQGGAAGTALSDARFSQEMPASHGMRCFRKPLRYLAKDEKPLPQAFVHLCVRPLDVVADGH